MIGFLNIDKPAGITSHDVVAKVRKISGIKKVGHAGTLDPFATGVLIVGIGREATKQLAAWHQFDKEYLAEVTLGATSDTDDLTGRVQPTPSTSLRVNPLSLSRKKIDLAFKKFISDIKQIPPAYAAIKQGGEKMYEKARRGERVIQGPRDVTIHEIEIMNEDELPFDSQVLAQGQAKLEIRVVCSTGTYIRALARDIGHELGVGGYCSKLTRTRIGPIKLENTVKIEQLTPTNLPPSFISKTLLAKHDILI